MRVLIVKTGALGDVVHAVPAVRAFKAARPEARLEWLVEKRWSPILDGQPFLDRVIEIETGPLKKGLFSAEAKERFWTPLQAVRQEPYEAVVDLQRLLKSGLMTRFAKAGTRIGFDWASSREKPAALLLSKKARVDYDHDPIRNQYAAPLSLLAGQELVLPEPPHLLVGPRSVAAVRARLGRAGSEPYAITLLGGGFGTKLWPPGHWHELLERLTQRLRTIIPFHGPEEEAIAREAARITGAETAPALSLPELAGLLKGAELVIGGDTGPLHLAAALDRPTLSLYGPTLASRNGPPNGATIQSPVDCAGCVKRTCPKGDPDCLAAIQPDQVWTVITILIS